MTGARRRRGKPARGRPEQTELSGAGNSPPGGATSMPVEETGAARDPRFLLSLLTAAVSFLVYLRTLAPAMHLGDGVELATAAHVLGVPHPTGYPFFMLLLKAASLVLPLGEVITRTTVLNALIMAAANGIAARFFLDMLGAILPEWNRKAIVIASACGALAGGFLRFHWDNAVVTEVYALQFLLTVVFTRVVQQFWPVPRGRFLAAAALVVGLGLAHHRLSVTMLLPLAVMVWRYWHVKGARAGRHGLAACVGIVMACLCLYLYLPFRAKARPPINWGYPATLPALVYHVAGGDYSQYRLLSPRPGFGFTLASYGRFASRITGQLCGDLVGQFAPTDETPFYEEAFDRVFRKPGPLTGASLVVFLLACGLGVGLWARASVGTLVLCLLVAVQNVVVIYLYNIVDITDYYLFPFWLGWACAFVGLVYVLRRFVRQPEVAYVLVLLPVGFAAANWVRCDQSTRLGAEDLSSVALPADKELMPEGSVLLTRGDHDIYTSWYRQLVRGERRDVLVFGSNFVHEPWYEGFFSPAQIEAYRLRFSSRMPRSAREFAEQLEHGVIADNVTSRSVFMTFVDADEQYKPVVQVLAERYSIRPVAQRAVEGIGAADAAVTVTLLRIGPK